jgi:hypothetical protein
MSAGPYIDKTKFGRAATSGAVATLSAVIAPAENQIMPTRAGSTRLSAPRRRTSRTAACPSTASGIPAIVVRAPFVRSRRARSRLTRSRQRPGPGEGETIPGPGADGLGGDRSAALTAGRPRRCGAENDRRDAGDWGGDQSCVARRGIYRGGELRRQRCEGAGFH